MQYSNRSVGRESWGNYWNFFVVCFFFNGLQMKWTEVKYRVHKGLTKSQLDCSSKLKTFRLRN